MKETRVIVNPRAGGGRAIRRWPAVKSALRSRIGDFEVATSTAPGDVAARVGAAIRDGVRRVVVVGGDGTVHEAVNGVMTSDAPSAATLGFIPVGTGCDFARTFGIETLRDAVDRIAAGRERRIDVGRVASVGCVASGSEPDREHAGFFANIASAGVSGAIVAAVNRQRAWKVLGARAAFFAASARELARARFPRVRIRVDVRFGERFDEIVPLAVVAIANGRMFGGGMRVAPDASPDDGLFDVVIVRAQGRYSRLALLRDLRLLYAGAHVDHPLVTFVRGASVSIDPIELTDTTRATGTPVECDGESAGVLPARFDTVPAAVRLLV